MTFAAEVTADSPLAWWRLGETAGSTTGADTSGNGHGLTFSGDTLGVAGLITGDADTALQASGTSATATTASAAFANLTTIALEAWIKTSTTGVQSLVDRDDGVSRQFQFRIGGGSNNAAEFVGFSGTSPTFATGSANVCDGNRHQLGVIVSGSALTVIVDGVQVATATMGGNLDGGGTSVMGLAHRLAGGQAYTGILDEVAVFPSLTVARFAAHYAAGAAVAAPSLRRRQRHVDQALARASRW